MPTFIGTEIAIKDMIANLIRLDYDAAAAYQAAIDRLKTSRFQAAMRKFKADHLRHTQELAACLRDLGHKAPTEGDMMQLLTTGKVVVAGIVGDGAILAAMRTNEDDTVTAYDRAVTHPDCPEKIVSILKRGQRDEHRHRAWIVAALKSGTSKRARRPARKAAGRAAAGRKSARRAASAKTQAGTRRKAKAARPRRAAKPRPSRGKRRVSR